MLRIDWGGLDATLNGGALIGFIVRLAQVLVLAISIGWALTTLGSDRRAVMAALERENIDLATSTDIAIVDTSATPRTGPARRDAPD